VGVDAEHSDIEQTIDRNEYTTVGVTTKSSARFSSSEARISSAITARLTPMPLDRWSPVETLVIEGGIRSAMGSIRGAARLPPDLRRRGLQMGRRGKIFCRLGSLLRCCYPGHARPEPGANQYQHLLRTHGAVTGVPIETQFLLKRENLRLPRFALTSFSAEKKLPWDVYGKVNLISREGSRGLRVPG